MSTPLLDMQVQQLGGSFYTDSVETKQDRGGGNVVFFPLGKGQETSGSSTTRHLQLKEAWGPAWSLPAKCSRTNTNFAEHLYLFTARAALGGTVQYFNSFAEGRASPE